jgi:hypothetical protein
MNDAKSCYYRIICNLAMRISQYYGINAKTSLTQGKTLQKMRFRLQTALREPKRYYQHTETTPIHGTVQGSCSSPVIWLLTGSILMDCLSELVGGMTIANIDSSELQNWIDGFVDDMFLIVNLLKTDKDPNVVAILHKKLREDTIILQDLLEASGGNLQLEKCF